MPSGGLRGARPLQPLRTSLRPTYSRGGAAAGAAGPGAGAAGGMGGGAAAAARHAGERKVLDRPLELCGVAPLTGFFRDRYCCTGPQNAGRHVVCASVTAEYTKAKTLLREQAQPRAPEKLERGEGPWRGAVPFLAPRHPNRHRPPLPRVCPRHRALSSKRQGYVRRGICASMPRRVPGYFSSEVFASGARPSWRPASA